MNITKKICVFSYVLSMYFSGAWLSLFISNDIMFIVCFVIMSIISSISILFECGCDNHPLTPMIGFAIIVSLITCVLVYTGYFMESSYSQLTTGLFGFGLSCILTICLWALYECVYNVSINLITQILGEEQDD